ncbi:MAG TPA: hypothetical protein VFL65_00695 [Jatrophihabitans sp.]|nr:hypothetical protein [Jatrophihabitans sp.]
MTGLVVAVASGVLLAGVFVAGYLLGDRERKADDARHAAALQEWLAAGLDGWAGDE